MLREPEVMLTHTPRIPGTDGRKMSKSYGNFITLSESDESIRDQIARHDDRSGAQAPHRSRQSRRLPRLRLAQIVFAARNAGMGCGRLPHARESAASSAKRRWPTI